MYSFEVEFNFLDMFIDLCPKNYLIRFNMNPRHFCLKSNLWLNTFQGKIIQQKYIACIFLTAIAEGGP